MKTKLNKKDGIITLLKPTKVQVAYSKYYIWLHEVGFGFPFNRPNMDAYTAKVFSEIKDIKKDMTKAEIKQFDEMTMPFKI